MACMKLPDMSLRMSSRGTRARMDLTSFSSCISNSSSSSSLLESLLTLMLSSNMQSVSSTSMDSSERERSFMLSTISLVKSSIRSSKAQISRSSKPGSQAFWWRRAQCCISRQVFLTLKQYWVNILLSTLSQRETAFSNRGSNSQRPSWYSKGMTSWERGLRASLILGSVRQFWASISRYSTSQYSSAKARRLYSICSQICSTCPGVNSSSPPTSTSGNSGSPSSAALASSISASAAIFASALWQKLTALVRTALERSCSTSRRRCLQWQLAKALQASISERAESLLGIFLRTSKTRVKQPLMSLTAACLPCSKLEPTKRSSSFSCSSMRKRRDWMCRMGNFLMQNTSLSCTSMRGANSLFLTRCRMILMAAQRLASLSLAISVSGPSRSFSFLTFSSSSMKGWLAVQKLKAGRGRRRARGRAGGGRRAREAKALRELSMAGINNGECKLQLRESLDLIFNEELELLQPFRLIEFELVLLQAVTEESLLLFLQEERLPLCLLDLGAIGAYLLEEVSAQAVDDHAVIVGHVEYCRRVAFDEPSLRQGDLLPATVGDALHQPGHLLLC